MQESQDMLLAFGMIGGLMAYVGLLCFGLLLTPLVEWREWRLRRSLRALGPEWEWSASHVVSGDDFLKQCVVAHCELTSPGV